LSEWRIASGFVQGSQSIGQTLAAFHLDAIIAPASQS
jgi:hypothetical protein